MLIVLLAFPTRRRSTTSSSRALDRRADRSRRLLAWVNRELAARARRIGFAGAVAGALVGAWLGFNATAGLLAVVTTIAGAAVGANLTLIVLDITRARSVGESAATAQAPVATVEA